VFASLDADKDLTTCEFLMPEEPEKIAASALADVPAHLRAHTSARLLSAIAGGPCSGRLPCAPTCGSTSASTAARDGGLLASPDAAGTDQPARAPGTWRDTHAIGGRIYELEERDLPATLGQLTQWLTPDLS
jgi:hypothetical protein